MFQSIWIRLAAGSLALTVAACAAELARWEAGQPSKQTGLSVVSNSGSVMRPETVAGAAVVRLEPSKDYYSRASYVFKVTRPVTGRAWLVIEFLDRGFGVISVSPGAREARRWGTVRVNTGLMRRATVQYDSAAIKDAIHITGLDYLHAIWITDQQPQLEYAPLVLPAVKFAVDGERVVAAAGHVQDRSEIEEALAGLRNELPLFRALGFNGVESYVRWGWVETRRGVYDWSFYDAIANEIEKHGMRWFPMLLAGSGYALPDWLYDSKDNFGFVCLEHGITHDTQSIFQPFQTEYASRFIREFGARYGNRKMLLGIRLGPSGDYGEAQYPAKGPGYRFRNHHTHIGYWAGDELAQAAFRKYLAAQYKDIGELNKAWGSPYSSFDQIRTFLPDTAKTRRQRVDFATWYYGEMSAWCEKWAVWSREAMPNKAIHQSSGGWGPVQIGTDYSYQARSMAKVKGGIRLTNESDNFPDNFTITRMASSAARFYGAALGYEPGGFGSKRGVVARLYNAVTTGAVHLFYYGGNLTNNDQAIDAWARLGPMLDQRAKPAIDVATFYPDTAIKLDDELVRYRWGSPYFTMARALRSEMDYDYASEQMIADGALDRYKVLVFLWGNVTEKSVLDRIDKWLRAGGTIIYCYMPRGWTSTVEGDESMMHRWAAGDTGKGKFIVYPGDAVPPEFYSAFVRDKVRTMPQVRASIRSALAMRKPADVYWSVLENGKLALLNFSDDAATVRLESGKTTRVGPYEMVLE
ncbi:MAG: beta-galactosidase [Bryobacteraceae bacterium]